MTTKPPHVCSKCKRTLTRARYCDTCMKDRMRNTGKRENTSQRRANVRFYKSKRWAIMKQRQLSKQPFCEWIHLGTGLTCNKPAYVVDHVVPRFLGGPDHSSNYQSLCIPHHGVKSAIEAHRLPTAYAHPSNLRLESWLGFEDIREARRTKP